MTEYFGSRPAGRNHSDQIFREPSCRFDSPEPVDATVEAVRADLLKRSQVGIAKYGVTLDKAGLPLREWLQHAYEETLDTANYLKAAITEMDRENGQ